MNITESLNSLFKKDGQSEKAEQLTENPYLNARRSWNAHVGGLMASLQLWQVVGIVSLLIALGAVGGVIHIGSQSKFIPYVIQVDKLGQTLAVAPVQSASPVDPRVIHASLAAFINEARLVTPDVALQRNAIFHIYAMLSPNDPATAKMNEWLNGTEDSPPFKRAAKETVNIEIVSVLPQTKDTWQVEWMETVRDRQGVMKIQPYRMRALLTVYIVPPTPSVTEDQIRKNPLGIYVRDFSWAKQV